LCRESTLDTFCFDRQVPASGVEALYRVAQTPADLAIPSFRTHELKGGLAGHYSIWVNGNWRVTFRFVGQDVELVDYQDYH
jgi:proteic killer suppression protein